MSQLRAIVERIENLEEEIKALNSDKSDIYKEAKLLGYDVKVVRAVVAHRRKDSNEAEEFDTVFEIYIAEINSGTVRATRVHVHEPDKSSRGGERSLATGSKQDGVRHALVSGAGTSDPGPREAIDAGDIPEFLRREKVSA